MRTSRGMVESAGEVSTRADARKNLRAVSSTNVKIPPIQLLPFLVMQKMFIAVGKRLTCGVFVLSGITREFGLSLFHVCKRKIP